MLNCMDRNIQQTITRKGEESMKRIKKTLLPLVLAMALCFGSAMTVQAAGPPIVLLTPGIFDLDIYDGFSEGLMPVKDQNTGKWGYINTAGQLAIPCIFEGVDPFSGGAAKVYLGYSREIRQSIYAFINPAGQMLYQFTTQQDVHPTKGFSEGYFVAQSNTTNKYGFMNAAGQLVVACQYGQVKDFSDGLAAVYDSANNYWGYVDGAGNLVLPCQYKYANSFEGDYAWVMAADGTDRWMLIDKSGRNVIPEGYVNYYGYDDWNTFSRNSGVVVIQDKTYWKRYLLDINGGVVGPIGNAERFVDGFSWDGNRLLNTAGQQIFATDEYRSGSYLGDGYSLADMKAGKGIVDRNGGLTMLPGDVGWAGNYSEGFAAIYSDATGTRRYGFVNMAGQVFVQAKYADVKPFSGGIAPVRNFDYKWGFVDSTGAEILPLQYDHIEQVKGATGVFYVRDNSGTYLMMAPPAYAANGAQVNFMAQAEVNSALNAGLAAEALGLDYRNDITREQIAAAAVKLYEAASGQPAPAVGATPFIDVDNPAVTQAQALGLIDGLPDGQFIPNAPVTKEQAAAILTGVSAKVNQPAPAVQAAKFEPEGSKKKTASIEEALATATRVLKKIKK